MSEQDVGDTGLPGAVGDAQPTAPLGSAGPVSATPAPSAEPGAAPVPPVGAVPPGLPYPPGYPPYAGQPGAAYPTAGVPPRDPATRGIGTPGSPRRHVVYGVLGGFLAGLLVALLFAGVVGVAWRILHRNRGGVACEVQRDGYGTGGAVRCGPAWGMRNGPGAGMGPGSGYGPGSGPGSGYRSGSGQGRPMPGWVAPTPAAPPAVPPPGPSATP